MGVNGYAGSDRGASLSFLQVLDSFLLLVVGLLWLLAAHASTTRGNTVATNRAARSESKRRGAALKILVYIYIYKYMLYIYNMLYVFFYAVASRAIA